MTTNLRGTVVVVVVVVKIRFLCNCVIPLMVAAFQHPSKFPHARLRLVDLPLGRSVGWYMVARTIHSNVYRSSQETNSGAYRDNIKKSGSGSTI